MKLEPWSTAELSTLREHAALGAATLAAMLGRSERAVRAKASELALSLRRDGETRGRRPAGLDPLALAAIRERRTHLEGLCPLCSRRPIEVKRAGCCQVCYQRELADAHRDAAARAASARELDAARQEKHRTRRDGDR